MRAWGRLICLKISFYLFSSTSGTTSSILRSSAFAMKYLIIALTLPSRRSSLFLRALLRSLLKWARRVTTKCTPKESSETAIWVSSCSFRTNWLRRLKFKQRRRSKTQRMTFLLTSKMQEPSGPPSSTVSLRNRTIITRRPLEEPQRVHQMKRKMRTAKAMTIRLTRSCRDSSHLIKLFLRAPSMTTSLMKKIIRRKTMTPVKITKTMMLKKIALREEMPASQSKKSIGKSQARSLNPSTKNLSIAISGKTKLRKVMLTIFLPNWRTIEGLPEIFLDQSPYKSSLTWPLHIWNL